jgi:hypothetical protein
VNQDLTHARYEIETRFAKKRGFWRRPWLLPAPRRGGEPRLKPVPAPRQHVGGPIPIPGGHPGCRGCRRDVGCTEVSVKRIERDVDCSRGTESISLASLSSLATNFGIISCDLAVSSLTRGWPLNSWRCVLSGTCLRWYSSHAAAIRRANASMESTGAGIDRGARLNQRRSL